ncbi:hypothetical protein UU9_07591 [Rhodanobacter fulvus Jip2]|uniref:Uncharacterized protein n=1 Tax=Rhodanobacter fulvus Jip2 TaxID=1163408 RepID=I4VS70_9GAMM|nr:hypothetical protein UU9_07591 [Rhodanobacter fulvus Jip2]
MLAHQPRCFLGNQQAAALQAVMRMNAVMVASGHAHLRCVVDGSIRSFALLVRAACAGGAPPRSLAKLPYHRRVSG